MITVVGGGFAGVEAAWAAANRGQKVRLYEMRPLKMTPAHQTDFLAELVCSNSFKSVNPESPAGLLKQEMLKLGSIVLEVAKTHSVPGGEALCVERNGFAMEITNKIETHPNIEVARLEWTPDLLNNGVTIIATGPLTSTAVSDWMLKLTNSSHLYFYDAVSPTVEADTINYDVVWEQSRYDKGEAAYLNCPFNKDQYDTFIEELLNADQATQHDFEKGKYFEGCMPIEEIAKRGKQSLAFGNFKPVGLTDPKTGRRPYAAVQLRPENKQKTLYSVVACQTRMKWGDQKRVLRMIPGLENAEFPRLGVIHQNIYLNSPDFLDEFLRSKTEPKILFAGQITGVEGYVESAATGILAGINATVLASDSALNPPPRESALGCLISHITNVHSPSFAPMNMNWGLFPPIETVNHDKRERRLEQIRIATERFGTWIEMIKSPLILH